MYYGKMASWKGIFLGIALFSAIFGPLAVLGGTQNIYVDKDNKGKRDGSFDHPYHTISEALKHVHGSANVFIGKGHYTENLTLPKNVKLIGAKDKGDVVIEADNNDQPTIVMRNKTEVNKITVVGGRHAIRVEDGARAKIVKSTIKGSRRDGIHIDSGSRDKNEQVLIDRTEIKNNRMAGVFSEKRMVVITNSDITRNGDGIDFTAGVKGWLADNRLNDNRGSGAKFVLDGASLWSTNNSIRRNGREGVEVNAYGDAGSIGLKKASIIDNHRFGITKLARTPQGFKAFGGLFLDKDRLENNAFGSISNILRAF